MQKEQYAKIKKELPKEQIAEAKKRYKNLEKKVPFPPYHKQNTTPASYSIRNKQEMIISSSYDPSAPFPA